MGTLAIRQGDVLYFARSLVWSVIVMKSEDIKALPDYLRLEWFFKLWDMQKKAGDFVVSQEAADTLAAFCNVTAPRVKPEAERRGSFLPTDTTTRRPGRRG